MPNALAAERSAYLRQHAHNPVQWLPWSEEAFARARHEDKLVFLSIGYSACHWCHVMEQESFSDEEVAAILNRDFISIKVDREERPDLDAVYMSICQAMTGHGGWPLTVILTPDKQAIFAGTYFPKRSTPYRIGLLDLLERVQALWRSDRERLLNTANDIMQRIAPLLQHAEAGAIGIDSCLQAKESLHRFYDAEYGGFGTQPKFPMAAALWFLLLWGVCRQDTTTLSMVTRSLEAMRWGGIWDHVGGGFHRYSTDREWFLPHFEKMLYDQALLLLVYAEAYAVTGNLLFRQTVFDIAAYLERSLALDGGAYAASEDADTVEGEGAYYQWHYDELSTLLTPKDFTRVSTIFNLQPQGNAHDEASGSPTGQNILYAGTRTDEVLRRFGGTLLEFLTWWDTLRKVLDEQRSTRPRPTRDDKVLCDWNGLAVAALARAGRILNAPELIQYAERVWAYLDGVHRNDDGRLWHCSYAGEPTIDGMLDDYAFVAWGLVELYQATGKQDYNDRATQLLKTIVERFTSNDGLLYNTHHAEVIPFTEPSDGATLSAVGITAVVAHALSLLSDQPTLRNLATMLLQRYGGTVSQQPAVHATFLIAYLFIVYGQKVTVECSDVDRQRVQSLLLQHYTPFRLWQIIPSSDCQTIVAMICWADSCSPRVSGWDNVEKLLATSEPDVCA